ncbi:DNA damage-inducible protein 1 [Debaryomyces fabryi]|uniref:DNA damage-inducible protein 1 n=1 Tax=Debaryomyces fabryi TaxID=58627 RepID=A0A0V1Q5D7_9ASCO|nr:DNA damage-inducible protein 1 [Debaryomyces fabryi]KSA03723.1 DNA damage-inducible protein 1 [Debaryomyces fabryi]CUM53355.1 unnamed protein product [Debaryomyces fabryi]
MRLTISNELSNQILSVDISESMTLEDFQAYIQAEFDISPQDQALKHNGKPLSGSNKSLEDLGLSNDDLVLLGKSNIASTTASSGSSVTANSNNSNAVDFQIEAMRTQFLSNPQLNNQLRQSNPQLHSNLNNPAEFKNSVIGSLQQFQNGATPGLYNPQQQEQLRRLQENPDDPESQARILEMIRQEQIDENMQLAYEIAPESFTSVNMLYINIKVNGVLVQAFVDSGAQSTIISPKLAEKCGISRLIDKRFVGEARGVGSQKIEGKIHSVPIAIGESDTHIPCSFIVIDTHVDLLFGLDMLRRHKCVLDLERDVLVVGGNIETKFLHELEIQTNPFLPGVAGSSGGAFGGPGIPLGSNSAENNNVTSSIVPANSTPDPAAKQKPPTAAANAAAKRQNTGTTGTLSSKFNESDIKQLVSLGFSKQEAIFALEQSQGNVEIAASLLFQ